MHRSSQLCSNLKLHPDSGVEDEDVHAPTKIKIKDQPIFH